MIVVDGISETLQRRELVQTVQTTPYLHILRYVSGGEKLPNLVECVLEASDAMDLRVEVE